ncbi:MAG: hypothetical protein ABIQ33_12180 [Caldimonas sp.]
MNTIPNVLRFAPPAGLGIAIRRLALMGIAAALSACGGHDHVVNDGPPVIATQPADQSVPSGSGASFSVGATGADPLAYQWSSSADGATFTPLAGATGSSYSVGATATNQSGTYFRVVVSNALGSLTSGSARLTVIAAAAAPAVTTQPGDQAVTATATAIFQAAASGTPPPTVQWQISTDGGVSFSDIAGATASSYTTPATLLADDGQRFRAVFTNGSGTVSSNSARLIVSAPGAARFPGPNGMAFDAAGNAYVSDGRNHTVSMVTPAGAVTTLAGSAGTSGSADGIGSAARFLQPDGLAVDAAGNVFVADSGNFTIRKVTPAGVVTTFAGLARQDGSADGTGSAARFDRPRALALDAGGNLYVADSDNYTIRKITPAGAVTTLAGLAKSMGNADGPGNVARFNSPQGIALDAGGNLFVADTNASTVRMISPGGNVTTLAGLAETVGSADGTGSGARFNRPRGIAVDAAGTVYVVDIAGHTVRRITPAGVVTTLAGLAGAPGFVDGTGSAARFRFPVGASIDAAGNVFVADNGNEAVRRVTPAGVVTTFAQ